MDRIDKVRGLPDNSFSANDRAFAQTVSDLSVNMEPEQAIELARRNTDPNDRSRIEARKDQIKEMQKGFGADTYREQVEDHFNPWFGSTTVDDISGDKIAKEYGDLFEQHYLAGMDEKAAKAKALEIVGRNWKESKVTGKTRVMKYAPEDYYDVAGNTEYIGEQLHKAVLENWFGDVNFSKKDIIILSDDRTAREASAGMPSYLVYVNHPSEGILPVYAEGAPARFLPDVSAEVKKQQEANREKVEEGRGITTLDNLNNLGFGGL